MKLKQNLSLLAAAVAALSASQAARALPANAINDAAAAVLYFGGATATDPVLEQLFLLKVGGPCSNAGLNDDAVATRIDIYRGTNQRAIVCTKSASITLSGGITEIVFLKESTGGSGNGTTTVALHQALQYLDLGNGAFACAADNYVNDTGVFQGYRNHTGCTPTKGATTAPPVPGGVVPEAGIADVEPRLLGLSAAQASLVTTIPATQVLFAPAVSLNFYRALQQVEGKPLTDLGADMPSLTEVQVRGLFNGTITSWAQLLDAAGVPMTTSGVVTSHPASANVKVCRRVDSSGTQASFRTQYSREGLNGSVVPGVATFVAFGASGAWTNDTANIGTNVFANSSGGDVTRCLDAHHDANNWAIGTLSVEGQYTNDNGINDNVGAYPVTGDPDPSPGEYRWIAVNGKRPTLESAANGNWDFFTENVVNKGIPIGSDENVIANFVANGLGNKSLINGNTGVNAGNINAFGDGGVMAIPFTPGNTPNAAPVSQAAMRANPVGGQRRTTTFTGPDNRVDTLPVVNTVAGGTP